MRRAKSEERSASLGPAQSTSVRARGSVQSPPCRFLRNWVLALAVACSLFPTSSLAKTDWPIVFPPFQNLRGEAEHDWLSTALPETARNKLHGTIYMRAFTFEEISHAVSQNPNLAGNIIEISKALRSDLLVMGSYRVDGDALELTANCVDPITGQALATYKSMGSSFDPGQALNDLLFQIAQALRIAIPPEQRASVERRSTEVIDAYREHGKGLLALNAEEGVKADVLETARTHFQEAIALDPNFAASHYRLGTLFQHTKDIAGAEKSYKAALRADIDHRDARYRLGLLLIDEGRQSEAMTELEQALKQAPEDPAMQMALSSIWFQQRQSNFKQMADALEQAIAASPDQIDLYVELGEAYEGQSRIGEAMDTYQRAISRNPKHPEAAYKLGMLNRNQGKAPEAAKLLKQAADNGTTEKRVHYYLGEMLTLMKDHKGAAAAFTQATRAEPNHTASYQALGNAHAILGQHQDALLAYNQYSQFNKEDPKPLLSIGQQYQTMGLLKQAMSAYQKSVQIEPAFADGHIAIGRLYELDKLTLRAGKAFKEALRIQPNHPDAADLQELIRRYQPAPAGNKR